MHQSLVLSLIAAGSGGALGWVAPGADKQQKLLGPAKQLSSTPRQYLSCAETYGGGWETCGDQNTSRLCYSPALGHSCCEVDNSYCGKGTWCAPVAGYCCLDSEDLEACARNAGFRLPGDETARDLRKRDIAQSPTPPRTRPQTLAVAATALSNRNADSMPATGNPSPMAARGQHVQTSAARKEQSTLGLMGLGIGAVGLFMVCC